VNIGQVVKDMDWIDWCVVAIASVFCFVILVMVLVMVFCTLLLLKDLLGDC